VSTVNYNNTNLENQIYFINLSCFGFWFLVIELKNLGDERVNQSPEIAYMAVRMILLGHLQLGGIVGHRL